MISLTDASYNRTKEAPSLYGGLFYISDYAEDYDQMRFIASPDPKQHPRDPLLLNASLIYWRTRVARRRVDTIMDVETLAIQYGTVVASYLNSMVIELHLTTRSLKPIVYNDNHSTISHIRSSNKHNNVRMNVIWGILRSEYNNNKFGLRFLCGKTLNLSDTLTKLKSGLTEQFYKALRTGSFYVPYES